MLDIKFTGKMKRDLKRMVKRGKNADHLTEVLDKLANEQPLEPKYKDHALSGDWEGCRDCHIEPDWVLIYRVNHDELILTATRTGSHADFGW
jgi:mRNA interferase YafQ